MVIVSSGFNPRSPRGERLRRFRWRRHRRLFQSTLPARGATALGLGWQALHLVSIHAPREGSDTADSWSAATRTGFNPRSPRGERHTADSWSAATRLGVSIHAPTRGERHDVVVALGGQVAFQSTLPARGATHTMTTKFLTVLVSIHAPPRGSDGCSSLTSTSGYQVSIHAPREGSDANCATVAAL